MFSIRARINRLIRRRKRLQTFSHSISIDQFGDSLTAGISKINGEMIRVSHSSSDIMYLMALQRFGNSVVVSNKGISGASAIDLIRGNDGNAPWKERVKKSDSDVFTFCFGMNDRISYDRTTEQFADDIRLLVDVSIDNGKTVVLIEPTPTTDPDRDWLPEYIDALNMVAEERNLQIVQNYKIWTSMSNWEELLSDGVHPTIDGYKIKGITEYQALAPLIIANSSAISSHA